MVNSISKVILYLFLAVITCSCNNLKKGTDSASKNTEIEEDKKECPNSKEGKLVNMTGLDGCGWMIELTNGAKLEPINLADFKIEMVAGKKVKVDYIEKNQMAGICMAGTIIEIKCIIEIPSK